MNDDRRDAAAARIDFETVFRAEREAVEARWDATYEGDARESRSYDDAIEEPTTAHGLVGLGMSGGGIRSATFNLGILQALSRRGVFDHVDYMSTVSGGGYLGSAVSAIMRKPGAEFPFEHVEGPVEGPYVSWLRNHSNYLVENGFIDYVRIFAILVRGIVLNLLAVLPLLLVLGLLVDLAYGGALSSPSGELDAFVVTPWVALAVAAYFLAYPVAVRIYKISRHEEMAKAGRESTVKTRNLYELSFAWALMLIVASFTFELLPILLDGFHSFGQAEPDGRDLWSTLLSGASVAAAAGAAKAFSRFEGILRAFAVYVVGLLGFFLPLLITLLVAEDLVYGQGLTVDAARLLGGMDPRLLVALAAVAVSIFAWAFLDVNLTSVHGMYRDRLAAAYLVGKNEDDMVDIEQDVDLVELSEPGSKAPYHLVNTALNLEGSKDPNLRERGADFFVFSKRYCGGKHTGYAATRDMETAFPELDLASAMAISAAAAAPNMGSYTKGSLVTLMALLNVRLGYWAPNPRHLVPWMNAKGGVRKSTLATRFSWRIRPTAMLREMFSRIHDEGRWVNLSDGGHIENLAGMELLRRRCRYVIIGDGEADPDMHFNGLATLMRLARLDLGVQIELLTEDLRLDEARHSRQHAALGRIWYPPRKPGEAAEAGLLLYLKLSITGDEDEVINEYRARNPAFPHESTADQCFDEGQFEAYRSLGFHAADGLFPPLERGAGRQSITYAQLGELFEALEADLAPRRAAEALRDELQQTLLEVQARLAAGDERGPGAAFDPTNLDFGAPGAQPARAPERSEESLATIQLQIMNRVVGELALYDPVNRRHAGNASWMKQFSRWAETETFRSGFASQYDVLSRRLRTFVEEVLGVPAP